MAFCCCCGGLRHANGEESHLVIVVLEVGLLALQLDHLQPGDPLLLFGRHQVAVRIPALTFSTRVRRLDKHARAWTWSSLTQAIHPPTLGTYAVSDWGVVCAGGGAEWWDQGTCSPDVLNDCLVYRWRTKARLIQIIKASGPVGTASLCFFVHL